MVGIVASSEISFSQSSVVVVVVVVVVVGVVFSFTIIIFPVSSFINPSSVCSIICMGTKI